MNAHHSVIATSDFGQTEISFLTCRWLVLILPFPQTLFLLLLSSQSTMLSSWKPMPLPVLFTKNRRSPGRRLRTSSVLVRCMVGQLKMQMLNFRGLIRSFPFGNHKIMKSSARFLYSKPKAWEILRLKPRFSAFLYYFVMAGKTTIQRKSYRVVTTGPWPQWRGDLARKYDNVVVQQPDARMPGGRKYLR